MEWGIVVFFCGCVVLFEIFVGCLFDCWCLFGDLFVECFGGLLVIFLGIFFIVKNFYFFGIFV